MTDNSKHKIGIIKDSWQDHKNRLLTNDTLNNFSGSQEGVIENNTALALFCGKNRPVVHGKGSSKLEILIKDSLLFFKITKSNLTNQQIQKEFLVI